MENFEFFNPVRIIFGPGEISKTGVESAKLGSKALLVSYKEHDFFDDLLIKIRSMLEAEHLKVIPFFEVTANPRMSQASEGVKVCKEEEVDLVIAVGGGSAMDAAKVIAAGVFYEKELWNMVVSRHDSMTVVPPEKALPLLLIPTLPATGSEMNCCAVITNEKINEKSYVYSPCLFPKLSIADPSLTCSLPVYQTACGAADTISHVLEFYLNGQYDAPLQNRIQEGVILTVMENVNKAMEKPDDVTVRGHLQLASIVALNGWSQPGDAWTPMHQLGHVLSARHDLAHGATLSIIMPAWMKCLYNTRVESYVQFADRIFGIEVDKMSKEEAAEEGIKRFETFLKEINVPTRLSDVNVQADEIDELTDDVVRVSFGPDGKLNSRPPVDRNSVRKVFETALN
jgi:alcohol dehydrogenase YqhD (iron-dependent ADH family)